MGRHDLTALTSPRQRFPRWLAPVLGYAVSIACLVWVYHGFDWKAELPKIFATDWRWVAVAVICDVCVYVVQGWRWSLVLQPIRRVPVIRSVQGVYIGLFANEVLPFRTGEVIRACLQSKWHRLPFSVAGSSVLIERLLDGVWLVLGFFVVTLFIELPGPFVAGARVLTGVVAVVGILLTLAVLHRKRARAVVRNSRWAGVLRQVVDGAHDMGRSRSFLLAAAASLLYLSLQVMPVYALARGYGLGLSFGAVAVVLVILRLGSVVPQAPSNVGLFQFCAVVGLGLFGIGKDQATSFATLLFVVVTVPLWLGGFIALLATKMRLTELRHDAAAELRRSQAKLDQEQEEPALVA